jgi:hypothetical protein
MERIIFEKTKELRGWYFVEYSPPVESYPFAMVDLVILNSTDKAKIAEAMESELKTWLARYPIPVMVSAFDDKEDLIHLEPVKNCNHLMGYLPKGQQSPIFHWRLLKEGELPNDALDQNYLKKVYHNIPFRMWTNEDSERVKKENVQMVRTAWLILLVWLVVIPLIVIILGETSVWVARMVLAYSLWKVFVQVLKLTGKWKKSPREVEREREKLEMEHHHYHCKRNPQAFLRLKSENFERETKERVQKEADALKQASSRPAV